MAARDEGMRSGSAALIRGGYAAWAKGSLAAILRGDFALALARIVVKSLPRPLGQVYVSLRPNAEVENDI